MRSAQCVGLVSQEIGGGGGGLLVVRPQAYVRVFWELPEPCMRGALNIALYRLGQESPEHAIVRKDLRDSRNMRRFGQARCML